jgi:hypothetical protein
LASNQYPSGKFPKVSIGIPISRAGSVSRGRDAATAPAFERNLSQATDGRSRPLKAAMLRSGSHKKLQTMVDLLQRHLKPSLLRFLYHNMSRQEPFPLEQEKNKAASLIN